MSKQAKGTEVDEIDLMELIRFIWSKRRSVLIFVISFTVLGVIIALTSPKAYLAVSKMIPETKGGEVGLSRSIGGLASLAGFDLGSLNSSSQYINPELYQSVSRSTPFLLEAMNQRYFFQEANDTLSLEEFFKFHRKRGLIGSIFSVFFKPDTTVAENGHLSNGKLEGDIIQITKAEENILEYLSKIIFVELDHELNIVTVQVEMQDPKVAAQMVQFTQKYITDYVIDYAISKNQSQLESIKKQYIEREEEFRKAQYDLASFRDRNQNVTTARARSEEEKLESEFSLAFDIYSQLAQQQELIKLKIQESTPVFTVLEPVSIPVEKSKPSRAIITIGFMMAGFVFAVVRIYVIGFLLPELRSKK